MCGFRKKAEPGVVCYLTGASDMPFELSALLSSPWQVGTSTIGTRGQGLGCAGVCRTTPIRYLGKGGAPISISINDPGMES